jgi:hypothetical protein
MQKQTPAYLWWLLNEYKIPAHLQDSRYGVKYRNRAIEGEIMACTSEQEDEALMDVVFQGLFNNPEHSVNGDEKLFNMRSGSVFDRIMDHKSGGVRDRARAYEDFADADRVDRLLIRWLRKYDGICVDFSFTAYQLPDRGTANFYAFIRNPVEPDYDTRNAKLKKILEEIRRREAKREADRRNALWHRRRRTPRARARMVHTYSLIIIYNICIGVQ